MPPVKPQHRAVHLDPAPRTEPTPEPKLEIHHDANYIWLALRDGYVCVVENWNPGNSLRTRVYRYNARLPRDMRMKIAAMPVPQRPGYETGLDSLHLVAAGLTLGVARARIRQWIKEWSAGDQA